MTTEKHSHEFYTRVLECAGFYRNGRPLEGAVWSAENLHTSVDCSVEQIDRAFKYQALLQREERNGRIGVSDIFELTQSPCIYFKCLNAEPAAAELTAKLLNWQQAVWNDGRAPMLWVVTPTQIRILNAYVRPRPGRRESTALDRAEILTFANVAEGLEQLRQTVSRERIQSGRFWESEPGQRIDRSQRVDRQLIKDLNSASAKLQEFGLPLPEAHRLLLRAVFASYLQARNWLPKEQLIEDFGVESFSEALGSPNVAKSMFDWLAETFNGDVFPHHSSIDYTSDQLQELKFLLEGGDPKSGQRYLWPYEFAVIPVELLSSIYESFSHSLDQKAAEARSTHYTPINLVELTLNEVFDDGLFGNTLPLDGKVADLACGSGVFLVQALRRLVGRKVAAGERLTRKLIRDTLYSQVFGIDILDGAVQIAAVSLYLAALELDPSPGVGNSVKFKHLMYPKDDREKQRSRRFFNLYEADSFDTEADFNQQAPFKDKQLSVVVGNPPWTRPAGERAESQEGEPPEESLHVKYCRAQGIRLPNQDPPDQAFFWRAADFTTEDTRLGLILSGRRFFSHSEDSVAAKRDLLQRFTPLVMVNLSELHREKIFPTAQHPAMIVVARNRHAERGMDFTYATVERSRTFKQHGTLEIGPELIKSLSIQRTARQEDFLKVASWASARDAALVDHVKTFPKLSQFLAAHNVRPHQGFILGNEENEVPHEIGDWPCLETEGWKAFGVDTSGLPSVPYERMERPRNVAIYRGPLFLFTLSLTETRFSSAICSNNLVYSQRYYGIPLGNPPIPNWAPYLNSIFNSSLATYFIFLTAAEWGVERDNINGADLRRLPVPKLDDVPPTLLQNVLAIEERIRNVAVRQRPVSARMREELDAAVFDLYGLDARQRVQVWDMIAYTINLQQKRENSDALRSPATEDLSEYSEQFIGVIDDFLSLRNERKVTAEIFDLPAGCPLQVMKFNMVDRASRARKVRVVPCPELHALLDRIAENLPVEIATNVYTRRNVRFYGPGEVYLIKPAQVRFWTRSAGMNDADEVLAEHLRNVS